jgi:signal transduction histidine kinase
VTHPEDRDRTRDHYLNLSAGRKENVHYEKRYLTRDGRTVWGHASVACLIGREDLPAYCIGLVQDITDRKRAEEELRETNRELDAFVYTVSHDLRSPLTPIIGFAEFLRQHCRERLDAETDSILAEIEGQGRKMLALLEDLLCLAKVGKLVCPREPSVTLEVLRESLADLTASIVESGTEVRIIEPLPSIGVPATLLAQIFRNLIGNAVHYSGKAGGTVEVGGERHHDRVRFFVRDHGPGVPPEERERIFDVFYRGSTGKHLKGTGIGLAIVQKIARLYQGGVWVEETHGGGATFWVEMIDKCTPVLAVDAAGMETEKAS